MSVPLARRRARGAMLTAIALSVALVGACSSPSGGQAPDGAVEMQLAEPDAYPVTIDHAYGSTTVTAEPQRIVTLGWSGQDAVLALGKVPVAVERFTGSGIVDDLLPWDAPFFSAGAPALLTSNPEVPYEQILDLDPDLILAVYSGITESAYSRLAAIAPTVAFPEAPWATSWQDQTVMIGAALGQPARAAELVEGVGAKLAATAEDSRTLAGKTFTYAMSGEDVIVFCPGDPRIDMLTGIGMAVSAGTVTACATDAGASSVTVGPERVSDLDADVFILVDVDGVVYDELLGNPLFANLPSVVDGRIIRVLGMDYAMATSAPSVLAIPYALDKFVGQLTTAVS